MSASWFTTLMTTSAPSTARARAGAAITVARLDRGWTKARLASEAGVSPTLIRVVESGCAGASLDSIEAVARALGGELVVDLRLPRPVGTRRQVDAVHAAGISRIRRLAERAGLQSATEVEIVVGRAHGWADLLLFSARSRRLIVIEFKTDYRDHGALERQVGFYAQGAAAAARSLGWQPTAVVVVVVMLQSRAVEAMVAANRSALRAAFPMRGRAAVRAILDDDPVTGRALLSLDPLQPGQRALSSFAVDGRRTDAAFRDYADAAERLRNRSWR